MVPLYSVWIFSHLCFINIGVYGMSILHRQYAIMCIYSFLFFYISWIFSLLAVYRKGARKDCRRSSGEGFYSRGKNSSYKKSTCSPWVVSFRIWKDHGPDLKHVFCSSDSITHLEAGERWRSKLFAEDFHLHDSAICKYVMQYSEWINNKRQ